MDLLQGLGGTYSYAPGPSTSAAPPAVLAGVSEEVRPERRVSPRTPPKHERRVSPRTSPKAAALTEL